jgi:predicted amidohydrolase YtcJ
VTGSVLLRGARLVVLDESDAPDGLVDVRIVGGRIEQVAPALSRRVGEEVVDAGGRWAMPGLWDAHVHLGLWALARQRLDVSGTTSPQEVLNRVAEHVAGRVSSGVVLGYGYRSAAWARPPTRAELDGVSGTHPVVLISGDGHNGWINAPAAAVLGVPPPEGALVEQEWFDVLSRLERAAPSVDPVSAYRAALQAAAAKGVVGITDFEFERGWEQWPQRFADGLDVVRVRTATYADALDDVVGAGLSTGAILSSPLLTMGPLKVISDGSLNTGTAYCCRPYAVAGGEATRGRVNVAVGELTELLRRADAAGLRAAVHAIGDASVHDALEAFAGSGASGSVEHVQLVARQDVPRFAALGVTASVQPGHLLDDREVVERLWPDRSHRCFAFASLLRAGARLALGSDAPVAPLDPWLAVAAAVHRSADARPPWNPVEALTVRQALCASTDGWLRLTPGGPGDVVLLDEDPLVACESSAEAARRLRALPVCATFVAGQATHAEL